MSDTIPAFTALIDLVSERIGGQTLYATDDFFAEKENLLKPGRGVFLPDEYTERGKWMDGWESRRKREPGHDWCLIKMGVPGVIHGVDIDTNHFTGNYPEHASVEATVAPADATAEDLAKAEWTRIVPVSKLAGGSRNLFAVTDRARYTHLRLSIYPDGGVARFRVHGEVRPDPKVFETTEPIDLALVHHGGVAVLANDMYFSHPNNLIMPDVAKNMGDGWETKRRRGPGNDWVVVKLGAAGTIEKAVVDTNHFKGNYPDTCSIEGLYLEDTDVPADFFANRNLPWQTLLPQSKLEASTQHVFDKQLQQAGPFTHVRLSIYPDGGISRLRLFGRPSRGQA